MFDVQIIINKYELSLYVYYKYFGFGSYIFIFFIFFDLLRVGFNVFLFVVVKQVVEFFEFDLLDIVDWLRMIVVLVGLY